jgi:hypothetical protein
MHTSWTFTYQHTVELLLCHSFWSAAAAAAVTLLLQVLLDDQKHEIDSLKDYIHGGW